MQTIALTAYLLFIAVYVFLVFSINSQVKKYILPHDSAGMVLNIFIFGAVVLIMVSTVLLFLVPWGNLDFNIVMPDLKIPYQN